MNHVRTQLQYGLTVAADCVVCFLLAGLLRSPWLPLLVGVVLVLGEIFFLCRASARRQART